MNIQKENVTKEFTKEWFISNLPPIESLSDKVPHSEESIHLIPVFEDWSNNAAFYLKMAIYSLQTFRTRADGCENNIVTKLYIEEHVLEECKDILSENHIDIERDILSFKFPFEKYGTLTKKVWVFLDEQLRKYKHVFVSDADLWIMKYEQKEFVPIFQNLFESYSDLSFRVVGVNQRNVGTLLSWIMRRSHSDVLMEMFMGKQSSCFPMYTNFNSLVITPFTPFFCFTPMIFVHQYQTFLRWFTEVGHQFGNDENVLALANLFGILNYDGQLLSNMKIDHIQTDFILDVTDITLLQNPLFTKPNVHGSSVELQQLMDMFYERIVL